MTHTVASRENYRDITDPRDQLGVGSRVVAIGCEDLGSGSTVDSEDMPVDIGSDCAPSDRDCYRVAPSVILANAGVEVADGETLLTKPNTHLDSLV